MASIELLKIILQLIKISPSFNLDDGLDLNDGFETASCRTLPKIVWTVVSTNFMFYKGSLRLNMLLRTLYYTKLGNR